MPSRKTLSRLLTLAVATAALLLAAGCALSGADEQQRVIAQLSKLYSETLAGEQMEYSLIVLPPRTQEFWRLYAARREATSQRVMLRELRKIIEKHGVSTLLFSSVPDSLRGPKEDALVNEMILIDTPCSPAADKELAEDPALKERMRVAAYGRRISGGR